MLWFATHWLEDSQQIGTLGQSSKKFVLTDRGLKRGDGLSILLDALTRTLTCGRFEAKAVSRNLIHKDFRRYRALIDQRQGFSECIVRIDAVSKILLYARILPRYGEITEQYSDAWRTRSQPLIEQGVLPHHTTVLSHRVLGSPVRPWTMQRGSHPPTEHL